MQFAKCIRCKIHLPIHRMIPVFIIHQNKKMRVLICERCKNISEKSKSK